MIGDILVADATVHCYNWAPENRRIPEADAICEGAAGFHHFLSGDPKYALEAEDFLHDWSPQELGEILFHESPTDFVCHHGTPIWDFFVDGHCETEKGYEMQERFPNRVITYAAVNPFLHDAGEMRAQVDELVEGKGVSGLKVYAARYDEGSTREQRLDDREFAFPMLERAQELGVKAVATHKAIPAGPVRFEPYGVSDMPEACANFPDLNFEVVHSGMAFVDDTTFLAVYPNCYFNLETSFSLINSAPRRFAEFMAKLLANGAEDRIFYSGGTLMNHPLPGLRAFMDFEMPQDLIDGYGCPPVTDEIKRKILGENFLRMHGIDPEGLRAAIADDEVSRKQASGLDEPWSNYRARQGVAG